MRTTPVTVTVTVTVTTQSSSPNLLQLPFDAHNHVQLGPSPAWKAVFKHEDGDSDQVANLAVGPLQRQALSGMAIMSTHPRDYEPIIQLANGALSSECDKHTTMTAPLIVVPCLGIHPWFLHELVQEDWTMMAPPSQDSSDNSVEEQIPRWIYELEQHVTTFNTKQQHGTNVKAIIGEFGLDKFHFNPQTKELMTDIDTQIQAMEYQLALATKLQLPVSLHCVHAMGPFMDVIQRVQKKHGGKLPPTMYFHAFGGKAAVVDQLVALLCGRSKQPRKHKVRPYFGFAPVINFRSPKTADVVRKVGIERLVLETDHEDAALIPQSMQAGIDYLSQVLEVTPEELVRRTNQNAQELYGIQLPQ